jgi:hypothetical protein
MPVALGFLLALWLCLAPSVARAADITISGFYGDSNNTNPPNAGAGAIVIDSGGELLFNSSGATGDFGYLAAQYGTLTNNGILISARTWLNAPTGSTLNNNNFMNVVNGGVFNNSGLGTQLNNSSAGAQLVLSIGPLYNQNSAALTNSGGAALFVGNTGPVWPVTTPAENTGLSASPSGLLNSSAATLTNTDAGTNLYISSGSGLTNTGVGISYPINTFLYNQKGATITNDGTLTNQDGAFLYNSLQVGSAGTSMIINENGAVLNNLNHAQLVNWSGSAFINETGATVTNNNSGLELGGGGAALTNTGVGTTLTNMNGGFLESQIDSTISNLDGANLTNDNGTNFYNQNGGAVTNDASIIDNILGATLTNTGAGTFIDNRNGATLYNDSLRW